MNKINKNNLLIVKMDKSMICQVSNIASSTLGSSFINEDILNNEIITIIAMFHKSRYFFIDNKQK